MWNAIGAIVSLASVMFMGIGEPGSPASKWGQFLLPFGFLFFVLGLAG